MAPITSTKYALEKFDGSNDFSLWRMTMFAVLIQQGLLKKGLPDTMFADEKEDMLERAHSAMLLKDCPECKWKTKDNSKTADTGVVEDNFDGADVLSVTINSSDEGWIIDTSCSYHMCPNRDWFATYHSFDGSKVHMENDVTCKVVRIGLIQIRMHDDIVRTLTDVRHVPELRKNLISLGTLDSNSCSYRAAGGVMRIMKGVLIMMEGLRKNSLYLLQGSTVTGAAATASSFDIDSNTTKLWHMRLGYMSERGMDVLSKQGLLGSKKIEKLDFCEHCVFGKQCKFKTMIEKQTGKEIKCLRIGNGMKFYLDEFTEFCYASGVKGYKLWCPDSKASRFLISRDVTFDESSILSKKKELVDAGKDQGVKGNVEL
ncbi:hypothetical protein RJ639_014825 [Escallonia herrerae]|uniref:GAG-pre-integrase domain-containing protein n=1 Tax=Escallonia herrerae TaxID=1293975 RepID=A0AA88VGE4_9ASTE|nr:hypothetical protein RJ639_014825 [Escallonia herrerae]